MPEVVQSLTMSALFNQDQLKVNVWMGQLTHERNGKKKVELTAPDTVLVKA